MSVSYNAGYTSYPQGYTDSSSSFGSVLTAGLTQTAIEGLSWCKKNKGNYRQAIQPYVQQYQTMADAYKSGNTFRQSAGNFLKSHGAYELLDSMADAEKLKGLSPDIVSRYNSARSMAQAAAKGQRSYAEAQRAVMSSNAEIYQATHANPTSFWGKTQNALGITKAGNWINNMAVKHPVFGKCVNAFNKYGGSSVALMEGISETLTNVVPTFQELGFKAGMKQVGKSVAKVGAATVGWVAGSAAGTAVGSAIGTAIGTAIGGPVGAVAGNLLGKVVGFIGGSLISSLFKKGAEKVVGEDEITIAQRKQQQQLAQQQTMSMMPQQSMSSMPSIISQPQSFEAYGSSFNPYMMPQGIPAGTLGV